MRTTHHYDRADASSRRRQNRSPSSLLHEQTLLRWLPRLTTSVRAPARDGGAHNGDKSDRDGQGATAAVTCKTANTHPNGRTLRPAAAQHSQHTAGLKTRRTAPITARAGAAVASQQVKMHGGGSHEQGLRRQPAEHVVVSCTRPQGGGTGGVVATGAPPLSQQRAGRHSTCGVSPRTSGRMSPAARTATSRYGGAIRRGRRASRWPQRCSRSGPAACGAAVAAPIHQSHRRGRGSDGKRQQSAVRARKDVHRQRSWLAGQQQNNLACIA